MAISKARKDMLVSQYAELLDQSDAIFIADYTGLSVKQFEELRSEVREAGGRILVTKNTLLRVALEQAGEPVPTELLNGQAVTGFATGEAPDLAKVLDKYAGDEEQFVVRGGLMDGRQLTAEDVTALAKMPSLDQLRGQLLGILNAPARNIAGVVSGSVRQVVNVLDAYSKKEDEAAAAA